MSENRAIGLRGDLPWHLPDELAHFKRSTRNSVVVMGRATFEANGRPLPRRTNIVLSSRPVTADGVVWMKSLADVAAYPTEQPVWIIGGARVYAEALPSCAELWLTHIHRTVEGDTFFPAFEERFEPIETLGETPQYTITRYRNCNLLPFPTATR